MQVKTSVSSRWRSEGDSGGQQPGTGCPAGQGPAEFERVEFEVLAVVPFAPLAAGRSGEGEAERLAVGAGPLGGRVGDETAVVAGVRTMARLVARFLSRFGS